jgi:hypothetical protein
MTDSQERSLERVGYDTSGEMNRSASFLIEDESAKEATSKEHDLVMASMREARQKYPWVKELEFSLVERDKDEFTRLVASHEDAAGNFIHVARGAPDHRLHDGLLRYCRPPRRNHRDLRA